MTEQGSGSALRIDVPVSKILMIKAPDFKLTDELVESVIDQAEILPETNRDYVRMQIRIHAKSYIFGKYISQRNGPPSKGKEGLKSLERPFRVILEQIESLPVDQSILLDAMVCRAMKSKRETGQLMDICRGVEVLRDAVSEMVGRALKSGNRELHLLEHVTGTLMLLFERTSGKRAKVVMNKDGEHVAELASPQANAIGLLLRHIDPSLEPSTIAGKIAKIRRKYPGKLPQEFALALWLPTQPVRPIPAEEA